MRSLQETFKALEQRRQASIMKDWRAVLSCYDWMMLRTNDAFCSIPSQAEGNHLMMPEIHQPLKYYCKFSDDRGGFEGIINHGNWQEVNVVNTLAECTRGGHYHIQTTEVIFLLTGKADVEVCPYNDPTKITRISLKAGEGIQISPMTAHRFTYQQNSSHLQLLDQRFDPSNPDLFNVNTEI